MTVRNLFDAIFSDGRAKQTALIYGQREISYGELGGEAIRMAQALQNQGVRAGDRVAILLHDSPEFIAAFIGIQTLGAIAVPINMGLGVHEQKLILNDCGACTAIVEQGICSTVLTDATDKPRRLTSVMVVERGQGSPGAEVNGLRTTVYEKTPVYEQTPPQ